MGPEYPVLVSPLYGFRLAALLERLARMLVAVVVFHGSPFDPR